MLRLEVAIPVPAVLLCQNDSTENQPGRPNVSSVPKFKNHVTGLALKEPQCHVRLSEPFYNSA